MLFQISVKDFVTQVKRTGAETVDREDLGNSVAYYLSIPRQRKDKQQNRRENKG